MSISDHIILKNNQFIAFNKPAGMAVQPDKTGDTSLMTLAAAYAKHPVFPVHRIDRPASGIVLMAKQEKALVELSRQFREREVTKTYLAIVKNPPETPAGDLAHYIKRGHNNKSLALSKPHLDAKTARLSYQLLAASDRYHLLAINLHTGRHHQIRAQLAAIGSPIKGDVKYGFKRGNKDRSIDLHHWRLRFKHPVTMEAVVLETDWPTGKVWEVMQAAAKHNGAQLE